LQTTNAHHSWAVSRQQLLDRLNTQQAEAVSLGWGPSLVVAGAGSGKTTVLTRRVAWLLSELKQPAATIMAVTFTNKAAAEMKARLEKLVGEQVAKRLTIGTFHSICARVLRREIGSYKSPEGFTWKSNFVIYDETDTMNVVKGVVSKLNLDDKVFPPKEMRHAISSLKNDGMSSFHFSQEARNYKDGRLSDIFTNYQQELARNNALDFDDLISLFTELLDTNKEVRERIASQYRHLLCDEFQDTNQSQYRMIRHLSVDPETGKPFGGSWEGRSLMVVGDVDQSIYSWRKADYKIFLGFQKDYAESTEVKLEENYRSTSTILDVANSIIVNNSERLDKTLRCNRGQGGKVRCYIAQDEIDEGYFIVEELKRLQARGIKLSDCTLLYRTNAQSRAVEEVLVRSHMPYIMVGGTRFYDRAEIKDVIAYLKLVYNPADGVAFNRVVNNPRRGLGKTTLDRVGEYAAQNNLSTLEAASRAPFISDVSQKAANTLVKFSSDVRKWEEAAQYLPVSQLVELVLRESTYLQKLEDEANETKEEVALGRVENVRELVNVAREFEEMSDEPNLEAFLTRIALVSDLDSAEMDKDAVKLMTLHSAKGLEFPTVFLLGLEEGLFPHIRSLNSPSALEEERRLMYVGVTRAEDRLYLTLARKRMSFASGGYANTNYTIPSRFLSEIKGDCMTGFDADPESMFRAQSSERSSGGGGYGSSNGYSSGDKGYTRQRVDDGETSPRPLSDQKRRVLSRTAPGGTTEFTDPAGIKPTPSFERLVTGDSVMHAKFGVGKVVKVIGEGDKELYDIKFETAGKKMMDPKYAKLVKLDTQSD
jgi:DNA helicase-2/ATP-dependent DNA helicase PcrA